MCYDDVLHQESDSEEVKDLKRQIRNLKARVEVLENRNKNLATGSLLETALQDLYPGEQHDFLLSVLSQIQDRCPTDSRAYDIVSSLLAANEPVGRGQEILDLVTKAFRNGQSLNESARSVLNEAGFTYTPSRKHPKLRFDKYVFTLAATPSDNSRENRNMLRDISKCLALRQKV